MKKLLVLVLGAVIVVAIKNVLGIEVEGSAVGITVYQMCIMLYGIGVYLSFYPTRTNDCR